MGRRCAVCGVVQCCSKNGALARPRLLSEHVGGGAYSPCVGAHFLRASASANVGNTYIWVGEYLTFSMFVRMLISYAHGLYNARRAP